MLDVEDRRTRSGNSVPFLQMCLAPTRRIARRVDELYLCRATNSIFV